MASNGRRSIVTLKEVADRALVSLGTASRVLNNHPKVQPDLRLRVLNAATELGYPLEKGRANYGLAPVNFNPFARIPGDNLALEVAPGQNPEITHVAFCCRPVISPLMDETYNPYFSKILHGVEAECRQQNLHLIYRIINDDPAALETGRQKLQESGAEALLLINFISEELVRGLLELNLPAVLVDHYFPEMALDIVSHENFHSAFRAVRYIIEKGHRRVGFINGLPHFTIMDRFEGYRRALEEAGIPFNPDYVIQGDLLIEGGIKAAHQVVEQNLDCTAYFCANDDTAIGFIQGLRSHKLHVPSDISVVGFDDEESARLITPALTTVKANPVGVGRMAVRRLLERVKYPHLPVTQTLICTTLVERDSVSPLRK
ncbi:MAG: LacI family transcriptional regulator [Chloroflexi bacterium]|jgi:DNA-binding LacI/PurR family transcriptional regulator|nr:LacI family transcriptional regulator [Chloroflexota bacterium]